MLRIFSCACWPYLRPYNQHKLSFRSKACVFLGYSGLHKGYKCLDMDSGRVYISRDIIFDETKFPFSNIPSSNVAPTMDSSSVNLNTNHIHIFPGNFMHAAGNLELFRWNPQIWHRPLPHLIQPRTRVNLGRSPWDLSLAPCVSNRLCHLHPRTCARPAKALCAPCPCPLRHRHLTRQEIRQALSQSMPCLSLPHNWKQFCQILLHIPTAQD
jgi:hypothetical protein